MEFSVRQVPCGAQHWHWCEGCINVIVGNIELRLCCCPHISYSGHLSDNTRVLKFWHLLHSYSQLPMFSKVPSNLLLLTNNEELSHIVILSSGETAMSKRLIIMALSTRNFVFIDVTIGELYITHNTMMRRPLAQAISHPPPRARHPGRPRSPQHSSAFLLPGVRDIRRKNIGNFEHTLNKI